MMYYWQVAVSLLFSVAMSQLVLPEQEIAVDAVCKTSGVKYRELRDIKGHFEGGTWDDRVDKFQGEKHLALQVLLETVVVPGQDYGVVVDCMGISDPVTIPLLVANELPHPSREDYDTIQLVIYSWRGNHDFVWAFVDKLSNLVVTSGFYHALE